MAMMPQPKAKAKAKTAAPAAVKTPNETQLRRYHVICDGRMSVVQADYVRIDDNHYTFIGEDGEPNGFFPTDRTAIVRLS